MRALRSSARGSLVLVISHEANVVSCARYLQEPTLHEGVEALLEPALAQFGQSYGRSGLRNIKPWRPSADRLRSESGEGSPPKGRKNNLLRGAVHSLF